MRASGGGGSDALIGGAVEHVDGCLLIEGLPVVWPDGYEWDEDEQAIRVAAGWFGDEGWIRPRLASESAGDTVTGGGGGVGEPLDDAPDAGSEIGRALGDCLGTEGVLVFNADSEIDVTKGFS